MCSAKSTTEHDEFLVKNEFQAYVLQAGAPFPHENPCSALGPGLRSAAQKGRIEAISVKGAEKN